MKNLMKTKKHKTSARVVDGKLILSFPDALTPVLWQMDLSDAKASALEVQENKEEKTYALALKTPRGEAVDIATFPDKNDAVNGLMAASSALAGAHGQIRSGGNRAAPTMQNNMQGGVVAVQKGGLGKWIGSILLILFLVVLIILWNSLAPRAPGQKISAAPPSSGSGQAGVPMSADDFLRSR